MLAIQLFKSITHLDCIGPSVPLAVSKNERSASQTASPNFIDALPEAVVGEMTQYLQPIDAQRLGLVSKSMGLRFKTMQEHDACRTDILAEYRIPQSKTWVTNRLGLAHSAIKPPATQNQLLKMEHLLSHSFRPRQLSWVRDLGKDIVAMQFSKDGSKLLITDTTNTIRLLCRDDLSRQWSEDLSAQISNEFNVQIADDGQKILASMEGNANYFYLWERTDNQWIRHHLVGHADDVIAVEYNDKTDQAASVGIDDQLVLWNRIGKKWIGQSVVKLPAVAGTLLFSPCNTKLAIPCADGRIRLWQLEMRLWRAVEQPCELQEEVISFCFSQDGQWLVACDNTTVKLWNITDQNKAPIELMRDATSVSSVDISADGSKIVAGCEDGAISMWHIGEDGWKLTDTLQFERGNLDSVSFSPTGTELMATSELLTAGCAHRWAQGADGKWSRCERNRLPVNFSFSPDGLELFALYNGDYVERYGRAPDPGESILDQLRELLQHAEDHFWI